MKKFLLVFCLIFLFALPSMAAEYPDVFTVQPSDSYQYYVVYNIGNETYLIWASEPAVVFEYSSAYYLKVSGDKFLLDSSSFSWVFNDSFSNDSKPFDSIVNSNFDIFDRDTGEVFFSPPTGNPVAQVRQIVQQQLPNLPQVITTAGSVVLPVALVILALILVTSLIPRLIRSFLR